MGQSSTSSSLNRVAFIGNYLPRQCGIATFTTDLCEAIATEYNETTCIAVPVNDTAAGYPYPSRVRFELTEKDIDSYRRAADFLNINNVDLVCLQHEYGIFGGRAGSHILALLRELRMPIVTTLHTILREPDPDQRRVLEEVAALSDRLVVMSERGAEFLHEIYGVPLEKIDLIPHGVPERWPIRSGSPSARLDLDGKRILLTYGFLSPNKGIEYVIRALPDILKTHPDILCVIAGTTHPHIRRRDGEFYRQYLRQSAQEEGVSNNVVFDDRFVSTLDLLDLIDMARICITPYLNQEHIVSGTLAYMVGRGKTVISTPYWHATELSTSGLVRIVPFRNSQAITDEVLRLLENRADSFGAHNHTYPMRRNTTWPLISQEYMDLFRKVVTEHPELELPFHIVHQRRHQHLARSED